MTAIVGAEVTGGTVCQPEPQAEEIGNHLKGCLRVRGGEKQDKEKEV